MVNLPMGHIIEEEAKLMDHDHKYQDNVKETCGDIR